jgi:hypothetical protein
MVDLASFNLHQDPCYYNTFEVIPLFGPLLPPINQEISPDIILNEMDNLYAVPCFDSFFSTYYVVCRRENKESFSPKVYLSENLTCSNFSLEME